MLLGEHAKWVSAASDECSGSDNDESGGYSSSSSVKGKTPMYLLQAQDSKMAAEPQLRDRPSNLDLLAHHRLSQIAETGQLAPAYAKRFAART